MNVETANTTNAPHFFILGAADPEMTRIEEVLKRKGVEYAYAMKGGARVHPGNAYAAEDTSPHVPHGVRTVFVECRVEGRPQGVVVDHHQAGDPGHGRPAADFWMGSSLGQVMTLLGADPSDDDLIIAAADHCLSHAYKGKCPGVSPDRLRAWRVASKAGFQGVSAEMIAGDIDAAIDILRTLPQTLINGQGVAVIGDREIKEAPEGAAILGVAIMYKLFDKRAQRMKVGILGGEPGTIEEWMKVMAPAEGLTGIYGSPERGYAGGYIET